MFFFKPFKLLRNICVFIYNGIVIEQENVYQTIQMITRVALFISLLSLFYYYCKEDGSINQYREPNDFNMIEVPIGISPTVEYESNPIANIEFDSLAYSVSSHNKKLEQTTELLSSVFQKY